MRLEPPNTSLIGVSSYSMSLSVAQSFPFCDAGVGTAEGTGVGTGVGELASNARPWASLVVAVAVVVVVAVATSDSLRAPAASRLWWALARFWELNELNTDDGTAAEAETDGGRVLVGCQRFEAAAKCQGECTQKIKCSRSIFVILWRSHLKREAPFSEPPHPELA